MKEMYHMEVAPQHVVDSIGKILNAGDAIQFEDVNIVHGYIVKISKLLKSDSFQRSIAAMIGSRVIEHKSSALAIIQHVLSASSSLLSQVASQGFDDEFHFDTLSIISLIPEFPKDLARIAILYGIESNDYRIKCLAYRSANRLNISDQQILERAIDSITCPHAPTAIECIELVCNSLLPITPSVREKVADAILSIKLNKLDCVYDYIINKANEIEKKNRL